jgi:RNA polymerase sigma factor (sigma-70 family)
LPPLQKYTEDELVTALKERQPDAFSFLYQNYRGAVYAIINQFITEKTQADDVLQEVFVLAWRNIEKYDPTKGRIFTWLHTLTRNTSINTLRSKQFKQGQKIDNLENFVSNLEAHQSATNEYDHIGLRKMVRLLKEDNYKVLELSYYGGFTHEEISKSLGIPIGTVKSRLRAAIIELRKKF